ncbi:MAG TPA: TetR/AcrR family transcriptional regulator [Bacteroidota bacterium]|nr:TetR/AcrR family transcriptional regulator [Bacteroidota bacterium]
MTVPSDPHNKEHRILDAAQGRFAKYGFSKVTMDEIAEDVGMAKASLYYYYPAKEHVFRAVIRREQEEFLRQAGEILARPISAAEKLTAYTMRRVELAGQLLNVSALNVTFWQNMKPVFKDLFAAFSNEELQLLTTILRSGVESDEFSISSPEQTAGLLLHALQGLRLRASHAAQFRGDNGVPIQEFKNEIQLLMAIVLHGIIKRTEH